MLIRRTVIRALFLLLFGIGVLRSLVQADDPPPGASAPAASRRAAVSAAEARGQADILHESLHVTLQTIHHEYFREDEKIAIPAVALENVFREVASRRNIEFRWLAVNTQAMNIDHEPQDDFEKEAVKAIAAGAEDFEKIDGQVYRRVGPIILQAECLKCHLPSRSSNKERLAGLSITIPIKAD